MTQLHFDPKCVSTFIQMDKPSYCPGQAVRIRVVSIKPDGKPKNGSVDIAVRVSGKPTWTSSLHHPVRRVSI